MTSFILHRSHYAYNPTIHAVEALRVQSGLPCAPARQQAQGVLLGQDCYAYKNEGST